MMSMDEALSYTLPQSITAMDVPELSLLQAEESQPLLIQQVLWSLYHLCAGLTPLCPCLSCTGQSTPGCAVLHTMVTQVLNGGEGTLALTYGYCTSYYLGMMLAFFSVKLHCWFAISLLSTSTPGGLLCRASFQEVGPRYIWCLCLFFSTVLFRTLHFPLLKFMRFLLNQLSSLSRSHMVAQLCGVSSATPSFASSVVLLRCTLSHHFRSLVKLLSSINPSNDP